MPTINKWIFTAACPMDEEQFFLASLIDEPAFEHPEVEDQLDWDNIDYEAQSTLWFYSPKYAKVRGDSNPWISITLDWKVAGLTFFQNHETQTYRMCILSEDGDLLLSKNQTFDKEKIADDVFILSDLQQIGEHLYACGLHGQVYKRLGDNQWQRIDNHQIKAKKLKHYEPYANEEIGLSKINGLHENAVYAVGFQNVQTKKEQKYHTIPKAYFYNGEKWSEIELPYRFGSLTDVYVESEKRIWICGQNGTLLVGNATDGFKDISSSDPSAYFLSIAMYRGNIWLVTPNGAYIYESENRIWMCGVLGTLLVGNADEGFRLVPSPKEERRERHFEYLCYFQEKVYVATKGDLYACNPKNIDNRIEFVVIDIDPPIRSIADIQATENTLWIIGDHEIARLDGSNWQRLDYPDNEDYTKILNTDDSEKQNNIGDLYSSAGNYKKAVLWYEKSAEQGNKYAQNDLGDLYFYGRGVEQNYKRAFEWFEKSARGGWYMAQGNLAHLYLEGLGTDKDEKKAFEWYYKAAQYSWSPNERERLGHLYENGIETEKNEQLAFEWYTKAAEQKDEVAQRKIGIMCEEGRGTEKNTEKAKEWYEKAIKNGDEIAKERLERLKH